MTKRITQILTELAVIKTNGECREQSSYVERFVMYSVQAHTLQLLYWVCWIYIGGIMAITIKNDRSVITIKNDRSTITIRSA